MKQANIRNFCIIAHIDHGKSTLADRFLELTKTVPEREMRAQLLDQMDIERERGITIKLQPVTMFHQLSDNSYRLNMIDTPGHVDFSYEVSRSLAAVEGALLLIDATQGIQAQTVANLYLALEQNLAVVPVLNKIDLPNTDVEKVSAEVCNLIGCQPTDVLQVSAKTGQGVDDLLKAIIERIPPPTVEPEAALRALIFDSNFDEYRGIIAQVRIIDGSIKSGDKVSFLATKRRADILEVGYYQPRMKKTDVLTAGDIGYIVTGLKKIDDCRVGDTISHDGSSVQALRGYQQVKPMVFAGIFCKEGDAYPRLREGIEKLKLNDAALSYEPEHSQALGFGFRCGFLGLLHLEVIQERLRREFDLDLVVTVPSVAYRLTKTDGQLVTIKSPQELPAQEKIATIEEPIMTVDIFTPKSYVGPIMQLVAQKRGEYLNTEYFDEHIAVLHYRLPLTSLLVDFYDKLKGATQGYASLNYDFYQYRLADVVRLEILVAEERVEALSSIVYRDEAYLVGKKIVQSLKETLPRQQFVLKIQAAVGGKIIAAERLSAFRKDVTAKLYGGDYTRKRKLLEKQKKGKKKMLAHGSGKVDIPAEAFMAVLKK